MSQLEWKSEVGFQVATDATRYYIRESTLSMISGLVFTVIFAIPTGVYGVWLLFMDSTSGSKVFAAMLLLVSAVFTFVLWSSVRRGRWMVVYERGEGGRPGVIRYAGKELPADRVRAISTRSTSGTPPRRTVVAELHDGTYEALGPIGMLTWPAYWGQQGANWLGLPFRETSE